MSDDHIGATTRFISRYLTAEEAIPPEHLQHIAACASCRAMVKRASALSAMLDPTPPAGANGFGEITRSEGPLSASELADTAASEVMAVHRRRQAWRVAAAAAVAIIAVMSWITAASLPHVRHRTALWWMMMTLFAGPVVIAFMTAGLESVSASGVYKQLRGRELSGVCRGLASASGIPVWIVRIVFVSLALLKGVGLIAYLILDVLLPIHPDDRPHLLRFRLMRWWVRRRQAPTQQEA